MATENASADVPQSNDDVPPTTEEPTNDEQKDRKEKDTKPLKVYRRPKDDTDDDKNADTDSKEPGNKFPVQVFLRMRPLVGKELVDHHESVEYKATETSLSLLKVAGPKNNRNKKYTDFKKVLLPKSDNDSVFSQCLLPTCIPYTFAGQKVCVFAYGHTGSGKTHTIFGYSKDKVPGMYQLFARNVFNDPRVKDDDNIFIEVRFAELYQGQIFDLLSKEKRECFLKEDEKGNILIRTQPQKCDDGKIRAYGISAVHVKNEEELLKVIADGIGSRQCGNSTLHDKSSRSHAFLEFEIVSKELVELRKEKIEVEADVLLHVCMTDAPSMKALLKKYKTRENIPKAKRQLAELVEDLNYVKDYNKLEKKIKVLKEKEKKIKNRIKKLESDPKRPFVGGTMVFVDLAGNEYGRDVKVADKQEERERNEINKSLLALKECIRALHDNKDWVGYRNSKLTMYLRPYLSGTRSKAIMISNIGPSKNYTKQTINTLQYTQLVAKA